MKKRIGMVLCLAWLLVVLCACGGEADPMGFEYRELEDGTLAVAGYSGAETQLVIDTFDGKTVTRIDDSAFAGNQTLTAVTLGEGVTEVGIAAFADCVALTSVDASASVLTRVGNAAFLGCDALVSVSFPATLSNVGVDAFLACDGLAEVAYAGSGADWAMVSVGDHNEALTEKLTTAGGETVVAVLVEGKCSSAVSWALDKAGTLYLRGEGHIPDYGYGEAPWTDHVANIRAVVITDGIDVIGKNAFGGCTEMKSVTIADSVRLIDNSAFYGCEELAAVTLPSNLRRIGSGAFYGCEELASVVIPDTVTHVGGGAFMNCRKLTSVTLSSALEGLEQWTFSGCLRLTEIVIPEGVTNIGVGAFYGCASMTDVTMGGGAIKVEKNAFRVCSKLATVHFRGDSFASEVKIGSGNEQLTGAKVVLAD